MEKLSFISYLKKQKEKYLKYKNKLEYKISQLGGADANMITLKTMQEELLKIKKKIDMLKYRESESKTIIDPYNNLKPLIDSINYKISDIDYKIQSTNTLPAKETDLIINQINEINILLDNTRANYTSVNTDKNIKFMKEKIQPELVADIYDKYIKDTTKLVDELKIQLGGGESLIDNVNIFNNIEAIKKKIQEYYTAVEPIKRTTIDVKQYIEQMESLIKNVTIDPFKPIFNDELEKIIVEPIESENIRFSYFDTKNEEIAEYEETDQDKIHTADFLNEMTDHSNEVITKKIVVNTLPSSLPGTPRSGSPSVSRPGTPRSGSPSGSVVLDPKNRKYYHSTKYTIEPKDVNMVITRDELDRHMNQLYFDWRTKLIEKNKINKELLPYIKTVSNFESDFEKGGFIFKNIQTIKTILSKDIINAIYNGSELNEKIILNHLERELQRTGTSINENINLCKTIIEKFKANIKAKLKINFEEGSKCTYENQLVNKNPLIKELLGAIQTRISDLTPYTLEDTPEIIEAKKNKKRIEINLQIKEKIKNFTDNPLTKSHSSAKDFIIGLLNPINIAVLSLLLNLKKQKYVKTSDDRSESYKSFLALYRAVDRHLITTAEYNTLITFVRTNPGLFESFLTEIITLENSKASVTIELYTEEQKSSIRKIIDELYVVSQNISTLTGIQVGGALPPTTKRPPTYKEGDGNINLFIDQLNEFEKVLRVMVKERKEVIKLIKTYNVRYTQFYNFQKYIVNYVSLKLAKKEYKYYNYLSKGTISFYESVLTKMEKIIDKYEDPKSFNDDALPKKENQNLYGRHYFMIKILRKFFTELFKYWSEQFNKPENKKLWSISMKIDLENKSYKVTDEKGIEKEEFPGGEGNKKYFFLFNIFFEILDAFHMKLPAVANYLRINKIGEEDKAMGSNTFDNKGDKHKLKPNEINNCPHLKDEDGYKTKVINAVQDLEFEEIFDPENFKENSNLSLYMGLGNSLSERKSIMLLTYGYSGVGKTFTLFGNKSKDSTIPPLDGLLQTTLKNVMGYIKIELKAFELYGLGVPYKFYWDKQDVKDFDHRIYNYTIDKDGKVNNPDEITTDNFNSHLDIKNNYTQINKTIIDTFSSITEQIDTIRKNTGRIRATLNNPESSRSIMIYDFKITFPVKNLENSVNECRFVIMDLPGKENLYQTYCDNKKKDDYTPKEEFYKFRKGPGTKVTAGTGEYDIKMIKTMMYVNPLWMATIPEIAEHFDDEKYGVKTRDEGGSNLTSTIQTLGYYQLPENSKTKRNMSIYENTIPKKDDGTPKFTTDFTTNFKRIPSNGHIQTRLVGNFTIDDFNGLKGPPPAVPITVGSMKDINLGLYGMCERAFSKISNLIQDPVTGQSKLFELGNKINDMLPDTTQEEITRKNQKYGYAGLEGVYINENILGLLEVLSEKIQQNRNKQKNEIVHVVCPQIEMYKKLYREQVRTPINYEILQKLKRANDNGFILDDNGNVKGPVFVEEDEFFSQIKFMKEFTNLEISQSGVKTKSFFQASEDDKYITKMRSFYNDSKYQGKEIVKNIDDPSKNWINNYDYNSIFNRDNPPIKSILSTYLSDPSFKNFYLFFVVSNNKKVPKTIAGPDYENAIDTCDKQLQLLFDTRSFMEVIVNEKSLGIGKCKI